MNFIDTIEIFIVGKGYSHKVELGEKCVMEVAGYMTPNPSPLYRSAASLQYILLKVSWKTLLGHNCQLSQV